MGLLRKFYKAKLEGLDDAQEGSYIAYISTFGDKDNVDKDGDFFGPKAFDKTLKKRKGVFPGVHMHNFRMPVALGKVEKDSKGLVVHAQINLETQIGRETYSDMKAGIMGDHSIGFNPNREHIETLRDEKNDRITGFAFHEVELLEFSPLTIGFAANDDAQLVDLKGRKFLFDNEPVENVDSIDTGGIDSLEEAKEWADLNAQIKGLTLNINKFCERR